MKPLTEEWPGVSYVMPVLNEAPYLRESVEAILKQDYPGEREIILAVAPSNDGTDELAAELAEDHPQVKVVPNPGRDIPRGLNLAICTSRHPVIIRVDAHSELMDDYTRIGIATLKRTGAANVGGLMRAHGKSPFQYAVAQAYNSPIALGGGQYHSGTVEGPCESAYLGIFRREVLMEVGLFDESIRRGEDWELNYRIRRAGYTVWFTPELTVTYWPRETPTQLARQFYSTGAWRGSLVRSGRRTPLRFFAPPALVASGVIAAGEVVADRFLPRRVRPYARIALSGPVAYAAFLAAVSQTAAARRSRPPQFLLTIAIMHISWGVGFWSGVLRGAGNTVDTSRLDAEG